MATSHDGYVLSTGSEVVMPLNCRRLGGGYLQLLLVGFPDGINWPLWEMECWVRLPFALWWILIVMQLLHTTSEVSYLNPYACNDLVYTCLIMFKLFVPTNWYDKLSFTDGNWGPILMVFICIVSKTSHSEYSHTYFTSGEKICPFYKGIQAHKSSFFTVSYWAPYQCNLAFQIRES